GEQLEAGRPDAVVDAIRETRLLGVASCDRGRPLVDVARDDPPAVGKPARHRERRVAGERPELQHAPRTGGADEELEAPALDLADHHLRELRVLTRLGREALEQLAAWRRVRFRVVVRARIHQIHPSYLPSRTHPLWPPRPIAFESATSTSTRRA